MEKTSETIDPEELIKKLEEILKKKNYKKWIIFTI